MGDRRLKLGDFDFRDAVLQTVILLWIIACWASFAASPFLVAALIAPSDGRKFLFALASFLGCVVALRILQLAAVEMYRHLRSKLRGEHDHR